MTSVQINSLMGLGILILSGTSCFLIMKSGKKPGKTEKLEQRTLQELSEIWAKKIIVSGEVHIAELAPLWKEQEKQENVDAEPPCEAFNDARIQDFYKNHIQPLNNAALQQTVCRKLLTVLDSEGQCSSVVNVSDDFESSLNSNVYTLLGKTTLTDHTLNVAEQMILMLNGTDDKHMTPDALITALAHDLGKVPSVRGFLYSMGEHPLSASKILTDIEEFEQLTRKDDISKAIMFHHKKSESFLGKLVKRADQLARQQEYDIALAELSPASQVEIMEIMQTQITDKTKKGIEIFYEEYEQVEKSEVPEIIDISHWFDLQLFLNDMKVHINRLEGGRKFSAFSMPNGYVYFMPKIMEEIARKQAEAAGCLDMVLMDDEDTRRNILLTIAHHLRGAEVFAADLLKKEFFGAFFKITKKGTQGKPLQGYYTPCHAEAFGSIAEMEATKTGLLKNFISVEPYHKEKA